MFWCIKRRRWRRGDARAVPRAGSRRQPGKGRDHIPGRAGAPARHQHHPQHKSNPGCAVGTETARTCCWPGFLAVSGRIWLRRNLEAALNPERNEKRLGATFLAEFSKSPLGSGAPAALSRPGMRLPGTVLSSPGTSGKAPQHLPRLLLPLPKKPLCPQCPSAPNPPSHLTSPR